jgi:hypothetical protein
MAPPTATTDGINTYFVPGAVREVGLKVAFCPGWGREGEREGKGFFTQSTQRQEHKERRDEKEEEEGGCG